MEVALITEDGTYRLRAALQVLAANPSYLAKKIIHRDPLNMRLV